jgi:hypothetical protein
VTGSTAGAISGTLGGVTKSATLTIKPPTYTGFTLSPNPVTGGSSVIGTITMSGPVAVDTVFNLTNANAKATLPGPTVTMPAGASTVHFTMTTAPTSQTVSGAVKATHVPTNTTKSVTLKVTH